MGRDGPPIALCLSDLTICVVPETSAVLDVRLTHSALPPSLFRLLGQDTRNPLLRKAKPEQVDQTVTDSLPFAGCGRLWEHSVSRVERSIAAPVLVQEQAAKRIIGDAVLLGVGFGAIAIIVWEAFEWLISDAGPLAGDVPDALSLTYGDTVGDLVLSTTGGLLGSLIGRYVIAPVVMPAAPPDAAAVPPTKGPAPAATS